MVAAAGSALAWPLLPETAMTTSLIGGMANAEVQYGVNGSVDPNDVILAYWTGGLTARTGVVGTIYWNGVGGGASAYLKGDDPFQAGLISGAGAGFGYGIGKLFSLGTNGVGNWLSDVWDPKFNPVLRNQTEVTGQFSISKYMLPSKVPGVVGNLGSSLTTEGTNAFTQEQLKNIQEKK